jgi:hypothetical protein
MMTRCGVVIGVVEFAFEARLAIPDFWAYNTSRLRVIPKGSPQRVRPLKGH